MTETVYDDITGLPVSVEATPTGDAPAPAGGPVFDVSREEFDALSQRVGYMDRQ